MFTHSHDFSIYGGHFVAHQGNSVTAFEKLQKASASSAFHDSSVRFDPPKCHPNTRVAVLEYLMGWIFGHNDPDALILWLYGPAGAGKSAILQTIAERCFERKVLLASFFFGRSDSTRNTFKPLVATIAYQVATAIPEIKPAIEDVIERDPLLFDKSIATQLQSLIIEPLKALAASGFFNDPGNCARLILIDGLDECNDPKMQSMILRVLANALRDHKLPLIFLIASRPEPHLTLTFSSPSLSGLWSSLVLDDSFEPDNDIRLFLQDSFQEIKSTHHHRHLISEVWPEPSDVQELVRKSSGQFIYASLVVKYISAPLDHPSYQLEVVMGLCPARRDVPFAELDALYTHILDSCADPETVLIVLGVFTCRSAWDFNPLTVLEIELLMDLQPGDGEISLSPLTSIINLCDSEYAGKRIQLCHASFSDFLFDISRSGRFHINTTTFEEIIIRNCLSKLMDPYECFRRLVGHPVQQDLFKLLVLPLFYILHSMPLTETLKFSLTKFSLPQVWSRWSHKSLPCSVAFICRRSPAISLILESLSKHRDNDERRRIYEFNLLSFEPTFKSSIQPYYQDVGLMSLLVVLLMGLKPCPYQTYLPNATAILFRLTTESMKYNRDTFSLDLFSGVTILPCHYRYLFTGPTAPVEFRLDGRKHAQTALRILEFLCDYPPYPIPYQTTARRNRIRKSHSARHRGPVEFSWVRSIISKSSPKEPSYQAVYQKALHRIRPKWLSDIGLPRKWREEKHRRGVALSYQLPGGLPENSEHVRKICILGLSYLPPILGQSSKSPELVDFIRNYGKDIVFIPTLTRKAISAMHRYLDRPEEVAIIVDI